MRLFLCEKPSQASDIARVLGAARRGEGLIEGNDFVVTWAFGHLLEQAPPEAYGEQYGSPWSIEVLPVIPEQWQMVVKDKVARQFNVIRRLLGKADEVVIATDADREGEIIARELLDYCGYTGVVRRLWLSALVSGKRWAEYFQERKLCVYMRPVRGAAGQTGWRGST